MKAVLISCFGYYDIRLKFVEQALNDLGFDISMIFSDYDHINKKTWIWENPNIKLVHVRDYKKNISLKRILSHIDYKKGVVRQIKKIEPDLVYCLIPPNILCKEIVKLKKEMGYKLFFDVIDLWPESFPLYKKQINNTIFIKKWKNMRDKYINYADFTILECAYYERFMKQVLKESKYQVVYICKKNEFIVKHISPCMETLKFCYLGSINTIIDIDLIVKLLSDIGYNRSVHLSIIGGGEGKFELLQKLTEANVPYRDYGMVFDVKELQEILSSCHFGLNMYKSTTCIGLTMKSCDYINAELPIINSNIYDTGILVEKYQSGFNISNEKYNVELTRLLELSDEQYKNMKRQAKKMKEELFLAESKKEEFKNIFKSVVEFKKTNDE